MSTAPGSSAFAPDVFRGRAYAVTGGARGIGEATVRQLASLGARVAVLDRYRPNLDRVTTELTAQGASVLALEGDVADRRFLERSIRSMHRRWGRIDGWVNNAMHNAWGAQTPWPFQNPFTPSHWNYQGMYNGYNNPWMNSGMWTAPPFGQYGYNGAYQGFAPIVGANNGWFPYDAGFGGNPWMGGGMGMGYGGFGLPGMGMGMGMGMGNGFGGPMMMPNGFPR